MRGWRGRRERRSGVGEAGIRGHGGTGKQASREKWGGVGRGSRRVKMEGRGA